MDYTYRRSYTGPLKGVILDWAGTTVDYGCFAPVAVFIEVFKQHGVEISAQQARAPMGLEKKDHIRALASQSLIEAEWSRVHGKDWQEVDIEEMYNEAVALQKDSVGDFAELIPGTLETLDFCRHKNLKIGSNTGYNRYIMATLLPIAASQGYTPDSIVCPDEVAGGRPAPWMLFQNCQNMGVYPLAAVVKVGDTVHDIEEGLNGGTWTIGLSRSGNELGLTEAQTNELLPEVLHQRLQTIKERLQRAGAHYVVETIAEVPEILSQIELRLQRGEQP